MTKLISAQFFKIVHSRSWMVMMIFVIPLSLLIFTYEGSMPVNGITAVRTGYGEDYSLATLLVGILSALLLTEDFDTRSIGQIISKGISRNQYAFGTLIAASAASFIMILLGSLTQLLLGTFMGNGMGFSSFTEIVWFLLWIAILCFTTTSFIIMITFAFRRMSVSIVVSLFSAAFIKYPYGFMISENLSLIQHILPIAIIALVGTVFFMIGKVLLNYNKEV